ncbi:MAG: hypothetical protein PHX51_04870 [Clostridia bacterium]|nr:hypothetical protein [Clostridia bacterium]
MKRIIVLAIALIAALTLFAGCGNIENVESLEIRGTVTTEFEVGDVLDLSGVSLKVTFTNGETLILNGDDSRLTFTGFNTTTTGSKVMVFKYEDVELEIPYTVYDQAINTQIGLNGAINSGVSNIRLTGSAFTTGATISVANDMVITGVDCTLNEFVFTATNNATVTFKNVNFAKDNADKTSVLTINGGTFVFENCTFTTKGYLANGITGNGNNVEFYNCEFVTETATDCFNYLVSNGANVNGAKNIYKNCTIVCNFWYGISFAGNLMVDGCNIESTITDKTTLKDSYGASYVNPNKQPVAFHSSAYYKDGRVASSYFNMSVTNTTLKNLQNVMRIYRVDNINVASRFNLVFEGNTMTNCNYVVNFSTLSWGHYDEVIAALPEGAATRYVAQNNTGLTKVGEFNFTYLDNGFFRYEGFNYIDKNGDVYEYVGYNGAHYVRTGTVGNYTYYELRIAYSADGLDNRTLTVAADPLV